MWVTVVFDSACSKVEIDSAMEAIRSLDGVGPGDAFVPISFNHHAAGLVRVTLKEGADVERLSRSLLALAQVTDVLRR